MTIIAVSTAQELAEALDSAVGGDRIELAAGDYGDFYYQKKAFDERVTITSADPDDVATFNSVHLNFVENITLEHVFVDHASSEQTQNFESALKVSNSAHVKIDNLKFEGDLVAHYPDGAGTDPVYLPVGRAASISNSQDVTFSNNEISVFRSGVNITYVEGITISDNDIHHVRSSGTGGSVIKDLVLTGNHFHDFSPYGNPSTDGDHSGFVHYWTKDDQDSPNSNFYIADNFFEVGGDGINSSSVSATLGINLDDNAREIGVENVLIENNVLHMAATMGIGVENGVGVVIRDNTLLQSGGEERKAPGIMIIGELFDNWSITNNILTEVDGVAIRSQTKDFDDLGLDISSNLFVQRFNPEADNYAGDLFVNALVSNGTLDDFRVIPGSIAEDVGANQLRPDGATSLVAITATAHDGLETLSMSVSVSDLLGGLSQSQIDAMAVEWNFGDGTTGSGSELEHTYATSGSYKITGTLTAPDGSKVTLNKVVEVKSPNGIDVRFDDGIFDQSDVTNIFTATGNVELVSTGAGKALRLKDKDARVKFDVNEELSNNTAYTLSFDFKYDHDGQSGFALYFPGTAIVQLDNGEMKLIGKTSEGDSFTIRSESQKLDDSTWHRASYVFSQATGTATLYIDGNMIGNVFGLDGIQPVSSSHGLTIGSPFGKSFTGQIDNISFLRAALTEDDIDLLHGNASVTLSDLDGEPEPMILAYEDSSQAQDDTPTPSEDVTPPSDPEQQTEPVTLQDAPEQPADTQPETAVVDAPEVVEAVNPITVLDLAPVNTNVNVSESNFFDTTHLVELISKFAEYQVSNYGSDDWLEWEQVEEAESAAAVIIPTGEVGTHLFGRTITPEPGVDDLDAFQRAADAFEFI